MNGTVPPYYRLTHLTGLPNNKVWRVDSYPKNGSDVQIVARDLTASRSNSVSELTENSGSVSESTEV